MGHPKLFKLHYFLTECAFLKKIQNFKQKYWENTKFLKYSGF